MRKGVDAIATALSSEISFTENNKSLVLQIVYIFTALIYGSGSKNIFFKHRV